MKNKNYGLKLDKIAPEKDYVLGGFGSLGGEVLQPNGQWDDYLPKDEFQNHRGFDPLSCVSFGTTNCIETLIRRVYARADNYSDRWLAKKTGTDKQRGNSPHTVAEFMRKSGVIVEELWPFTQDIGSFEKYYAEPPQNLDTQAVPFVAEFGLKHEYVLANPAEMKKALQYSPLGASVYAWPHRDANGYYFKLPGETDNHFVMLYGFEDGKYWKVFDSSDNSHKKVRWDTQFQLVKRYSLTRQIVQESFFQKFLKALRDLFTPASDSPALAPSVPQDAPNEPTPAPALPKPQSPSEKLLETAKLYIGKDASPNDLAPDELGCADTVSAIVHEAFPDFPANILSTVVLNANLKAHPKFKLVKDPQPGDIIVSPTVGKTVGHTGICFEEARIASNNSFGPNKGRFTNNYSLAKWGSTFESKKGLAIHLYRRSA
jgi:hypothetical protein